MNIADWLMKKIKCKYIVHKILYLASPLPNETKRFIVKVTKPAKKNIDNCWILAHSLYNNNHISRYEYRRILSFEILIGIIASSLFKKKQNKLDKLLYNEQFRNITYYEDFILF